MTATDKTPDDGGPAFPQNCSLRDWFAGQALAGAVASISHLVQWQDDEQVAFCYKVADAMLAERAKGAPPTIEHTGFGDGTVVSSDEPLGECPQEARR